MCEFKTQKKKDRLNLLWAVEVAQANFSTVRGTQRGVTTFGLMSSVRDQDEEIARTVARKRGTVTGQKVAKTDKLGHSDNLSLFPGNCAGNKPPGARQNTQPCLLLWDYEYIQIRVFLITPTGEGGSETKYPPAQA